MPKDSYGQDISKKKQTIKQFYKDNKEQILTGAVIILLVKNSKLKSQNYKLLKALDQAMIAVKDAEVHMEALSMMDKYFGKKIG